MVLEISSLNPVTGKRIKRYRLATQRDLDTALVLGKKVAISWREATVKERTKHIARLAWLLLKKKKTFAALITQEMGKPITQSLAEIEKCAWCCRYYATHSEKFLSPEQIQTENKKSYVRYDPLGTILGVMPWNFPFWQVFRYSIPALAAGNVTILKHSNIVPGCSLAIRDLFHDAGFPRGVFQSLITDADGVAYLLPHTDGVSVTGSVETGTTVAQQASTYLKKYVLELGGSDPFIVLDDADLDIASKNAVTSRFFNTGQSCIAAKRFIVTKKNASAFVQKVLEHVAALRVGDPMEKETNVGPLVREEQRERLERQVQQSVRLGAVIRCGGSRITGDGFFFQPTVIVNVKDSMPVVCEETFGPVMPIIVAQNERDALNKANATEFGLGASLWTKNRKKAEHLVPQITAGFVAVNAIVRSDPRLPFGGVKKSGIGRELGRQGLYEFTNCKTVVVN